MQKSNNGISGLYGFLAKIFATEVSPELLEQIRGSEFRKLLTDMGIELEEEFFTTETAVLIDQLAIEFTGLFIGPGNFISPHESVHRVREDGDYGKLWGADTVAVKKFVEATGLSYQSEFGGMPDHIAAELEFVQKLEERYEKAETNDEKELAGNLVIIRDRFLVEHLLAWAPGFMDKVINKATLPFYREIAELTKIFLQQEDERIQQPTEEQ